MFLNLNVPKSASKLKKNHNFQNLCSTAASKHLPQLAKVAIVKGRICNIMDSVGCQKLMFCVGRRPKLPVQNINI